MLVLVVDGGQGGASESELIVHFLNALLQLLIKSIDDYLLQPYKLKRLIFTAANRPAIQWVVDCRFLVPIGSPFIFFILFLEKHCSLLSLFTFPVSVLLQDVKT